LVFPKIFLLHKVVRDAKKVEKHCLNESLDYLYRQQMPVFKSWYHHLLT